MMARIKKGVMSERLGTVERRGGDEEDWPEREMAV